MVWRQRISHWNVLRQTQRTIQIVFEHFWIQVHYLIELLFCEYSSVTLREYVCMYV